MTQTINNDILMNELYPYPKYAKAVQTLDFMVNKLHMQLNQTVDHLSESNKEISDRMKEEEGKIEAVYEKIKKTHVFNPKLNYQFNIISGGKISVFVSTEDRSSFTYDDPLDNANILEYMKHIEIGRNMIVENKDKIKSLREPVLQIKEIASYSDIIEVYRGDAKKIEKGQIGLWTVFPDGIYLINKSTFPTIQTEENIPHLDIAKINREKGDFRDLFENTGYPTYLVINPSRIMNRPFLEIFSRQIIDDIRTEYSLQSNASKLFQRPFLWDMEKRIDYFKKANIKGDLQ